MKNNFEYQIDKLIEYLNNSYKAYGWKNHPKRLHNGKYIEGEKFDYIIISKSYKCAFDAKETTQDKWIMDKKDIIQAENLRALSLQGIDCFFLIYFYKKNKYYKLPIKNMFDRILIKKTWHIEDMENFKLETMF